MTQGIAAVVATACICALYFLAAFAVSNRWGGTVLIHPLMVTAHIRGRASLSRTQVLFFTFIFVWITIYWLVRDGELVSINHTVLTLLGIAVAGAGLGRVADTTRFRVSGENWAWAKDKNWISQDFSKALPSDHSKGNVGTTPKLRDLFTSDQGFEVARFQAVAFSLVVGVALLYNGATANGAESFDHFEIEGHYLTLIGISQGVYVGGKLTGGNLIGELNKMLDRLRSLELEFTQAVAESEAWREADEDERTMKRAKEEIAPKKYSEYKSVASEAAVLVQELTGVRVLDDDTEPKLPPA